MPTYLERYLRGEHEAVWDELSALGDAVRQEPTYGDAVAVAREAMRRLRQNVETLIARYPEIGYELFPDEPPYRYRFTNMECPLILGHPSSETLEMVHALEAEAGPLPIVIRAFYEIVGSVNLCGDFAAGRGEGWPSVEDLDPLLVFSVAQSWDGWRQVRDDPTERAEFQLMIGLDNLLKYEYGGVGPFTMAMPNGALDAPMLFEEHEVFAAPGGGADPPAPMLTFMRYLRNTLQWGGFNDLGYDKVAPASAIALLTEGLLPI